MGFFWGGYIFLLHTDPVPATWKLMSSTENSIKHPESILPPLCILAAAFWEVESQVKEAQQTDPGPGNGPPNSLYVPAPLRSKVLLWGRLLGLCPLNSLPPISLWTVSTLTHPQQSMVTHRCGFSDWCSPIDRELNNTHHCGPLFQQHFVPLSNLPSALKTADLLS